MNRPCAHASPAASPTGVPPRPSSSAVTRGALGGDRVGRALVAGDHQAATRRLARRSRRRLGRQVDRGLGLVGQAQDGRQHPGLGQGPHRVGTGRERRPAPALVDLDLGQLADPHGHLGDDAEGALRAEEQLAQVRAGGVRGRRAEPHLAPRRRDPEADDQGVEAAVARAGLAGGPGGREATDRGELERLRVVAEQHTLGGEQRLGLGAAQPRLEDGGHGLVVDGDQPLHPEQVERDQPGEAVAARGQAAGHAGAAAERARPRRGARPPRRGRRRRRRASPGGRRRRARRTGRRRGRGAGRGSTCPRVRSRRVSSSTSTCSAPRTPRSESSSSPDSAEAGTVTDVDGRGLVEPEGQLDQATRGVGEGGRGGRVTPALGVHLDLLLECRSRVTV